MEKWSAKNFKGVWSFKNIPIPFILKISPRPLKAPRSLKNWTRNLKKALVSKPPNPKYHHSTHYLGLISKFDFLSTFKYRTSKPHSLKPPRHAHNHQFQAPSTLNSPIFYFFRTLIKPPLPCRYHRNRSLESRFKGTSQRAQPPNPHFPHLTHF